MLSTASIGRFVVVAVAVSVGLVGLVRSASAEEEPEYKVLESREGFEIRYYEPYLVAETIVTGTAREAGSQGFRILAGYIFGDNKAGERMNMTTPVTTRERGTKMKMTVPVTTAKNSDGARTMRFVMERKFTLKTLPKPNNPRVSIVEIPERTVASLRYSGPMTDEVFYTKRDLLLKRLSEAGIKTIGQPVKAVFDGPWTPSFRRRNEVQVEINWKVKTKS
jgi:effector-binding domain-containing protein